jgi:hypothetical protein
LVGFSLGVWYDVFYINGISLVESFCGDQMFLVFSFKIKEDDIDRTLLSYASLLGTLMYLFCYAWRSLDLLLRVKTFFFVTNPKGTTIKVSILGLSTKYYFSLDILNKKASYSDKKDHIINVFMTCDLWLLWVNLLLYYLLSSDIGNVSHYGWFGCVNNGIDVQHYCIRRQGAKFPLVSIIALIENSCHDS